MSANPYIDPSENIGTTFVSDLSYAWDPSFISHYTAPAPIQEPSLPGTRTTKLYFGSETTIQDNVWKFGHVHADFSGSVITGVVESSKPTAAVPFSLLDSVRSDLQVQLSATEDALHTLIRSPTTIATFNNIVAHINDAFAQDASNATSIFASINTKLNNYNDYFSTSTLDVSAVINVGGASKYNTIKTDASNNLAIESKDHDINLIAKPGQFVSMKDAKVDTLQSQTPGGLVKFNSDVNMNAHLITNLPLATSNGHAVAFEQYAQLYNWALHVNWNLFRTKTLDQTESPITPFASDIRQLTFANTALLETQSLVTQ